jgi:hypothetical protein
MRSCLPPFSVTTVGARDYFLLSVEGGNGGDRTEGLLPHDQGGVGRVGEERGLHEELSRRMASAAHKDPCAPLRRIGDLGLDLRDRPFVNEGTDVNVMVETRTHP